MKKTILLVLMALPCLLFSQNNVSPDQKTDAYLSYEEFKKEYSQKGVVVRSMYEQLNEYRSEKRSEETDSIKKIINKLTIERRKLAARFVRANPDSMQTINVLITSIIRADILDAGINKLGSELYEALTARVKESDEGKRLGELLKVSKTLMVGVVAPEFPSTTIDGKPFRLSDYRGKYVLLDFWASWCTPCRAEFPYLKAAYDQFKNKNFEIVGVSVDNDRAAWMDAIQKDSVDWVQVSNLKAYNDEYIRKYLLQTAVPQNWLIGPDGKIIAFDLRGEKVSEKLKELLH